ncbi:MAG: hypothetical protein GDA36_07565 [Rhodobacteraceae bacterium]|nr:hypothetical protein [Paracoccaceae bacterium]
MSEIRERQITKIEDIRAKIAEDFESEGLDGPGILYEYRESKFPELFNGIIRHSNHRKVIDSLNGFPGILSIKEGVSIKDSIFAEFRQKKVNTKGDARIFFKVSKNEKLKISVLWIAMQRYVFSSQMPNRSCKPMLIKKAETYKPEDMFETVRGRIAELGDTLGNFEANIKLLAGQVMKTAEIIYKGARKYNQLPEPQENKPVVTFWHYSEALQ